MRRSVKQGAAALAAIALLPEARRCVRRKEEMAYSLRSLFGLGSFCLIDAEVPDSGLCQCSVLVHRDQDAGGLYTSTRQFHRSPPATFKCKSQYRTRETWYHLQLCFVSISP